MAYGPLDLLLLLLVIVVLLLLFGDDVDFLGDGVDLLGEGGMRCHHPVQNRPKTAEMVHLVSKLANLT